MDKKQRADKKFDMRVTDTDLTDWQRAAKLKGFKLSQWARATMNRAAKRIK